MDNRVSYVSVENLLALREWMGLGPVRDVGLLESAAHRPQSIIFGLDAYPDLFLKAAALLHSLVSNHALFDGNKRISWAATIMFLDINGVEVVAEQPDALAFMLATARGEHDLEAIAEWLRVRSRPLET